MDKLFPLIMIGLVGVISTVFAAPIIDNPNEAWQYLRSYKYVEQRDMNNGGFMEADLEEGIKRFQRFANITVTGELDDPTMAKMNQPRCGAPDMMFNVGETWNITYLTYRVDNVTLDFGTAQEIEQILTDALKFWSDVSNLSFRQVFTGPNADIVISFASYSHGDLDDFDGPGGIFAHAYNPGEGIGGDVHFDESENFTAAGGGINLMQVAVHEFGHSLGLLHSRVDGAVMNPFYTGYDANFALHADDIEGIQRLYGASSGNRETPSGLLDTTTHTADRFSGASSGNRETPFSGPLDTITHTAEGSLYAFRGNLLFRLIECGVDAGYPREISAEFHGLPNDLDASLYMEKTGKTYFFKGSQYYRFTNHALDTGYPKSISAEWRGIPNDLDAAVYSPKQRKMYFLKGIWYYKFSWRLNQAKKKRLIKRWDIPPKIDAALQWGNLVTYFFTGKEYYGFSLKDHRILPPPSDEIRPYPHSIQEYWLMECPAP